jgi:uncharacterized protein (DUF433 family)
MSVQIGTDYRYVTSVPGVCGGRPVVRGTRISVKAIVGYYKMGLSVEEILDSLPHLTPAQVHDALSYYYDHQVEIEKDIEESRVEHLVERYGLGIATNGRLVIGGGDEC